MRGRRGVRKASGTQERAEGDAAQRPEGHEPCRDGEERDHTAPGQAAHPRHLHGHQPPRGGGDALIDSVLNAGGGRRRSSSSSSQRGASSGSSSSGTRAPSPAEQAKLHQAFDANDTLSALMAAGRERFQPATRPVLPAPSPMDPAPLEAAEWAARKSQASIWRRGERKRLRLEAAAAARGSADERDREFAEQHRQRQVEADAWWERLSRGEERTLTAALKEAFADNPAPVDIIRAEANEAALVLRLPGPASCPSARRTSPRAGRQPRRRGRRPSSPTCTPNCSARTCSPRFASPGQWARP